MAFGASDQNVRDVMHAGPAMQMFREGDPRAEAHWLAHRHETLRQQVSALEAAIEKLEIRAGLERDAADTLIADDSQPALDILISHSHRNRGLVQMLIDLLEAAFRLPSGSIRCTSVDGYKFDGGVHVSSSLRREVATCKVMLAVLSSESLESFYVAIEIGGRLFAQKPLIPLRAPGFTPVMMKPPLSEFQSFDVTLAGELHHLIEQLGRLMGLRPAAPASYQRHLDALVALQEPMRNDNNDAQYSRLSGNSADLLRYFVQNEDREGESLTTEDVARGMRWTRSVAQHHLDDLLERLLVSTAYFDSRYRLTVSGRRQGLTLQEAASPI
jgi:hypothetical protein